MNLSKLKNVLNEAMKETLIEKKDVTSFVAPKHRSMILLMKRKKDKTWGLPGGRIEKKEDVETAAKRETAEETNMEFNKVKKVTKFKGVNKNIHLFSTKAKKQLPVFRMNKEHNDYGFFKLSDLKKFVNKEISEISSRNDKGKKIETFTRSQFKLHKPAKLFILNN